MELQRCATKCTVKFLDLKIYNFGNHFVDNDVKLIQISSIVSKCNVITDNFLYFTSVLHHMK